MVMFDFKESTIEVQPVEMAAYPTEDDPSEYKQVCFTVHMWKYYLSVTQLLL